MNAVSGLKSVVKSELLKLKRRTTLFVLPVTMSVASLIIAFTTCISLFIHFRGENHHAQVLSLSNKNFLGSGITLVIFFLGVAVLSLSASSFASEFSLGTIKNCFINQPSRMKFTVGKAMALILYSSALYLLSCFICVLATLIMGVAGGVNLGTIFSGDAILTTSSTFLGSYIALLAYTMIGLISGAIVRSSAPALSIPLIWLVVIEPVLGGAVKTLSSYLPGALIAKVATPHSLGGFSGNLLLLLLYLLPMVYFACRMTATRDI